VEIYAKYPAGKIGDTKENLLAAADGEKEEWGTLYPEFEKTAKKKDLRKLQKHSSKSEKLKNSTKKDTENFWIT